MSRGSQMVEKMETTQAEYNKPRRCTRVIARPLLCDEGHYHLLVTFYMEDT